MRKSVYVQYTVLCWPCFLANPCWFLSGCYKSAAQDQSPGAKEVEKSTPRTKDLFDRRIGWQHIFDVVAVLGEEFLQSQCCLSMGKQT